MPAPQARAPPALPDELIEEVLLRVRPDDPASLARAAVACRRWRRLVADPDFRRRRLELHRGTPPPMLGVLCDGIWEAAGSGGHPSARFVPTSTCRPPPRADDLRRGLRTLDARHGRVLLHSSASGDGFIVWDPITDRRVELPGPPFYLGKRSRKATVLCAATGGVCDHRNCHRGPFIVVLVGTSYVPVRNPEVEAFNMFSCIYSSESDAWSMPTYHDHRGDDLATTRSALVGNTLFFGLLRNYGRILKYDLGRQHTSTMRLPRVRTNTSMVFTNFVPELTTLEDGRLGFARVEKYSELCLWSRDAERWTLCKQGRSYV